MQLTEEQVQRLKAMAAERGISLAELIRQAVDLLPSVEEAGASRLRAIARIGGFHSGARDTSEGHDRYLTDAFSE